MSTQHSSINHWPLADRPREKLLKYGEHTLSNSELLAILLRSGAKGQSALDLARKVLAKFKTFRNMSHTDKGQWQGVKGVGMAKITQIKAAIEIGRRFREEGIADDPPIITSSQDVIDILMPRMRDLKKEVVKVLFLDSRNRLTEIVEVEEGTVNQASPMVREIFTKALQDFAVSLICVHNHPSGNPAPSSEDQDFTKKLSLGGKILQIDVLDHIIIGDNDYYSFLDQDAMPFCG